MNRRTGFTLIELLIVVVVIGILAAVGIPKFSNTKSKALITAMKVDLRNLLNAEETFFADSARYTTNVASLGFTPSRGVTPPAITITGGAWTATNSHTQLASIQCGIAVNSPNPLTGIPAEGEPACR